MNLAFVAKALFSFEEQNAKALGDIRLKGWMVWPVIKSRIYFSFFTSATNIDTAGTVDSRSNTIQKGFNIIKNAVELGREVALIKKQKKPKPILFYNSTINKFAKTSEGVYYNYLTDELITLGIVSNYIYAEQSYKGTFNKPYLIPIDLQLDRLNSLSPFYKLRLPSKKINSCSAEVFFLIQQYLKNNSIDLTISEELLVSTLKSFYIEILQSRFLLKKLKPSCIIATERVGSGMLAAARSLGIPAIDLQHGVMDPHDGMYQYSAALKPYKHLMCIPDEIGVWGFHFKNFFIKLGFWQKSEIRILGNPRINAFKKKYSINNVDSVSVLLPTQWIVFEETKQLLESLSKNPNKKFRIILKIHPTEPQSYINYYQEFQRKNSDWTTIANTSQDIYKLISSSKVVVGFTTTTLIESVALGIPAITLITPQMPDGIHYYLGDGKLKDSIKPLWFTETDRIVGILNELITQEEYYNRWSANLKSEAELLFASDYITNATKLVSELPQKNSQ